VARTEPASLSAGSRAGQMPRIEWVSYPTPEAAVEALGRGEVHYLESPPVNLLPRLREMSGVQTAFTDPLGNVGMAVFNHEIAPFNNARVRRAVLMALNQNDYMTAAVGEPTLWRTCYSIFPCDSPLANEAGNEVMRSSNVEAARAALRRAGYRGAPVVIMNPTDIAVISAFTRVTADRLREIGLNVQVEDMTWDQLLQRRNTRRGDGAWNMFHTWWVAADLLDPSKIAFSGNPQTGWIGWPRDRELERLRASFVAEQDPARRRAIAERVQQRILSNANFAILGQFYEPIAFRDEVTGQQSPIQMYYRLGLRR
jgi:peptide/nickel transport system substrate-binding protein